jgi:hypothetical protein
MPVKKTTKKATPRAAAKKAPAKVSLSQASTSTMKKADVSCATTCSTTTRTILLLVANTVLLLFLLSNYTVKKALTDMEIQRVGGVENYELIQQIYNLDTFKQQQSFQIQQTLQALQGMGMEQQQGFFPEDVEFMPE